MIVTRTLCLTDVVDSTKLASALGEVRLAALWTAHNRLARELLSVWRGVEIERTDGVLAMFERPADALGFAAVYHASLRELTPPVQARVGIHTGSVTIRVNPAEQVARGAPTQDVDGLAIAVAARVMSVARGGQTLLTADVPVPGEQRLCQHGWWRFKGLPDPISLVEQIGGGYGGSPPEDSDKAYRVVPVEDRWQPAREIPTNLPAERDPFIGRQADLSGLARWLDEGARLVSVIGIGGAGKTRLALHYGRGWLGAWPGGVWFCDLSEARDLSGITLAVAAALDVPLGKDDAVTQLGRAIAARGSCLLVLDNFEQVARLAEATVGAWLDRAPEARFIVTTREVLALPGEVSLVLPPLRPSEAAELFVRRAEAARRDFRAEDEAEQIAALVELLDRLPLAIELAAARVRLMSPTDLLARMGRRFDLLTSTGGRRDRQGTLRATLDWSWELLPEEERSTLAQLSVFQGGFTLTAAEAVLDTPGWPGELLAALVDRSLIRSGGEGSGSRQRLDLLVSVAEYAAERLRETGGTLSAEVRHGRYYASLGDDAALEALDLQGGPQRRKAYALELDNLRAACARAVARGDGPVAVGCLSALWGVYALRGPHQAAVDLARSVLAIPGLEEPDKVRAWLVLGEALHDTGHDAEAEAPLEAALTLALQRGDRPRQARALHLLGNIHEGQGRREEARQRYEDALALQRALRCRVREGALLNNLGILLGAAGRYDEARRQHEAALAIHREVGNRRLEGTALGYLGTIDRLEGRVEDARRRHREALAIHRELGNRRFEGVVLGNLANSYMAPGEEEEARRLREAALKLQLEVGHLRAAAGLLCNMGAIAAGNGRPDEGYQHLLHAWQLLREVSDPLLALICLQELAEVQLLRGYPEDARAYAVLRVRLCEQRGDAQGLEKAQAALQAIDARAPRG